LFNVLRKLSKVSRASSTVLNIESTSCTKGAFEPQDILIVIIAPYHNFKYFPKMRYFLCLYLVFLFMLVAWIHFMQYNFKQLRSPIGCGTQLIYKWPPSKTSYQGDTTLVTMHFDMPTIVGQVKQPQAFDLGENILSIASPMVIFTDCWIDDLIKLRDPTVPTLIVYTQFAEMKATKRFISAIRRMYARDRTSFETKYYTPELFVADILKPEILSFAANLNPFGAQKFVYLDIDATSGMPGYLAHKPWPSPRMEPYLARDRRIMMQTPAGVPSPCLNIRLISHHNLQLWNYYSPNAVNVSNPLDFPPKGQVIDSDFIAGTIFGGRLNEIVKYERLFYQFPDQYLKSNQKTWYFNDWHFMGALACTHPELIEVIVPPSPVSHTLPHYYLLWFLYRL
jgi:hypothetical protein